MESETFTHDQEYHDIVNNKETLKKVTEKFLSNVIDELTLGIIFDTHRKYKTKAFDLDADGSPTNDEELQPNQDIFGQNNMKKTQECECPNCDRAVAATRFAPHLEACMGMGRSRSRNASRRIANNNSNNNNNKERDSTQYTGLPSDDEDDADWSSGDKRRKKKHRNGNKKGKGTPKKATSETESTESVNVDIEGDEDGDVSLRDFLQDNSNHSSPAESSNNSTGSKKKDKSKNKKSSKRDRTSPSTSLD